MCHGMAKVCVTGGATGFLGGYLVRLLEEKGYNVVAFGRNEDKGNALESESVTFVNGDLKNLTDLLMATSECDYVIHCGALSSAWGGPYEEFYEANVVGTKNVMDACRINRIKRVVYVSTPSIYTSPPAHKQDIKEEDYNKDNNLNNYIKTKLMSEALVKEAKYSHIEKVIIRPRGLIGGVGDPSLIPRLLRANHKVGIPLVNEGKQLIDITCVENVAYSLFLAMTVKEADGHTFNITNGEPMPFKEILSMFLKGIEVKANYLRVSYSLLSKIVAISEWLHRHLPMKKKNRF